MEITDEKLQRRIKNIVNNLMDDFDLDEKQAQSLLCKILSSDDLNDAIFDEATYLLKTLTRI